MVADLSSLFKTKTDDSSDIARLYVEGLLSETSRKNMERMDERLGANQYEAIQHFISSSPWEHGPVFKAISLRASARIGARPSSSLSVDECANTKKGRASVGVARQYNGRLGKEDNCQVGVFSALNSGSHTALTGARLYLPEEWTNDPERCRSGGVPEARIKQGLLTKIDLARELVEEALANGVSFSCVACDAFYGRDGGFRRFLEGRSLVYCADVPSDARVFTQRPELDRRPAKITPHTSSVAVLAKAMASQKKARHVVNLREGENGMVQAHVWVARVWSWPPDTSEAQEVWLLVRQTEDGGLKTSLCNAGRETSAHQLAQWQAGRFYIERAFQDAKSHAGMAQYQARGWRAWHHHMALVSMAMLFMMEERLINPLGMRMLSARDIVELMDWHLVKPRTEAEVLDAVRRRHQRRERNGLSAQARKRKELRLAKNKSTRKPRPINLPK